mmetsp:Transcript_51313/g.135188  ORF Transcript_51313/g.135188 Transcript_51313/m.135188 type:complete len:437 (-) Transcript_51313:422-1732(-)
MPPKCLAIPYHHHLQVRNLDLHNVRRNLSLVFPRQHGPLSPARPLRPPHHVEHHVGPPTRSRALPPVFCPHDHQLAVGLVKGLEHGDHRPEIAAYHRATGGVQDAASRGARLSQLNILESALDQHSFLNATPNAFEGYPVLGFTTAVRSCRSQRNTSLLQSRVLNSRATQQILHSVWVAQNKSFRLGLGKERRIVLSLDPHLVGDAHGIPVCHAFVIDHELAHSVVQAFVAADGVLVGVAGGPLHLQCLIFTDPGRHESSHVCSDVRFQGGHHTKQLFFVRSLGVVSSTQHTVQQRDGLLHLPALRQVIWRGKEHLSTSQRMIRLWQHQQSVVLGQLGSNHSSHQHPLATHLNVWCLAQHQLAPWRRRPAFRHLGHDILTRVLDGKKWFGHRLHRLQHQRHHRPSEYLNQAILLSLGSGHSELKKLWQLDFSWCGD